MNDKRDSFRFFGFGWEGFSQDEEGERVSYSFTISCFLGGRGKKA